MKPVLDLLPPRACDAVFLTTVLLVLGLINYAATLLLRIISATLSQPRGRLQTGRRAADHVETDRLRDMLSLCSFAYTRPNVSQMETRLSGWMLQHTLMEGTLWFWQHLDNPRRWTLVVRGTQHIHELRQDWHLFWDSLRCSGQSGWAKYADELWYAVERLVVEVILANYPDADITIVGHSLGASHGEHILHRFQQRPGNAATFSAVTFDSPGQPQHFRRSNGMPTLLPNLTTLNAHINIINTLNKPCAETLWCCDSGTRFRFSFLSSRLFLVSLPTTLSIVLIALRERSMQHQLHEILNHIGSNNITLSSSAHWPAYGPTIAAATATRPRRAIADTPPPNALPARPRVAANQPQQQPVAAADNLALPILPATREAMMPATPYKVHHVNAEISILRVLQASDRVVALVGDTMQGKTSTFKTLLVPYGLLMDDPRLVLGNGVNTTLSPVIAWATSVVMPDGTIRRIFLIDLPGLGAREQYEGEANDFVQNSATRLLHHLRAFVGTVYFVRKEALFGEALARYQQVRDYCGSQEGVNMRVVYNCAALAFQRERYAQEMGRVTEEACVVCNVIADPSRTQQERIDDGHDATQLLAAWNDDISVQVLANDHGSVGARREAAARDEQDAVLERLAIAAAGAASAFAVWYPGLAAWGALAGPYFMVPAIGAIATGPVTVAAGATYVAGRRLMKW